MWGFAGCLLCVFVFRHGKPQHCRMPQGQVDFTTIIHPDFSSSLPLYYLENVVMLVSGHEMTICSLHFSFALS